jgi:hypothetical protein
MGAVAVALGKRACPGHMLDRTGDVPRGPVQHIPGVLCSASALPNARSVRSFRC